MIVKIVQGSMMTWYDCKIAEWIPRTTDKDPGCTHASIKMVHSNETADFAEIECVVGNAVYFMSDSGKTIDSMRW